MIKIKDGEKSFIGKNQEQNYRKEYAYDVDKLREGIIGADFKVGSINFETPISNFLKNNINRDISSYIYHKEINILGRREKLILFILKDLIVIADRLEFDNLERLDTQVSSSSNLNISDSYLLIIDYKSIYDYDFELKENNKNLILKLIRSENFTTFSNLAITFRSYKDIYIVRHFIDTYKTLSWQKFFEFNTPIPKPLIYQNHFFLQKINKRGKQQSRVITFTNKFIMNIPFTLTCKDSASIFELDSIKWALAIESIKSLSTYKKKPLAVKLTIDKNINSKIGDSFKLKSKGKKEIELLFYYESDMTRFVYNCRNFFYSLSNRMAFLTVNII